MNQTARGANTLLSDNENPNNLLKTKWIQPSPERLLESNKSTIKSISTNQNNQNSQNPTNNNNCIDPTIKPKSFAKTTAIIIFSLYEPDNYTTHCRRR